MEKTVRDFPRVRVDAVNRAGVGAGVDSVNEDHEVSVALSVHHCRTFSAFLQDAHAIERFSTSFRATTLPTGSSLQ